LLKGYILTQNGAEWGVVAVGHCCCEDYMFELKGIAPRDLPPGSFFNRDIEARINSEYRGRWRRDRNIEQLALHQISQGNIETAYIDLSSLTPLGRSLFKNEKGLQNKMLEVSPNASSISEIKINLNQENGSKISFDSESDEGQKVNVTITNLNGNVISEQNIWVEKGKSTPSVDLPKFTSGFYIAHITKSNAKSSKLIIIN
jgi:hypothetical protein